MIGKTICIEAQRLFRKQKHGMDVVALELLQRLRYANTDYHIKVLVKEDEDRCLQNTETLTVQTLKPAFYPLWEQWVLPDFLSTDTAKLLHCTGNTAPVWGKTPLLVTIHDLIFLEENYLFKKDGGSLYQRFGNFYRSLVVPIIAKRAKYIITVSEFQRQLIIKMLHISPDKISVVYNGADERFFVRAEDQAIHLVRNKYKIGEKPYFFFLANTEPRKNTDGVLQAFLHFCKTYPEHEHHLVIKGLTDEILRKKIAAAGAESVSGRIHRVGYIDYDDLPLLYQGASALWFPSFSEGFGLPIVEAMAGGTPVITSEVSVMPEIAGDAALYVNPKQPMQLAEQTHTLLTDTSLRKDLVAKGHIIAAKFTWTNSVNALRAVYEKLLN